MSAPLVAPLLPIPLMQTELFELYRMQVEQNARLAALEGELYRLKRLLVERRVSGDGATVSACQARIDQSIADINAFDSLR